MKPALCALLVFAGALCQAIPVARTFHAVATTADQSAPPLAVTLAVDHPSIAQPFPARVTLTLRNTGSAALWLYRHVRGQQDIAESQGRLASAGEQAKNWTAGGSSLIIHLVPADAALQGSNKAAMPAWSEPPHGKVLTSVGLPHPRLVRLDPRATQTEGAVVELDPGLVAQQGHDEPLWGHYRFSVSYDASYSNGAVVSRDLGVNVWEGEAVSNQVDVDLEPAPATAEGSISGRMTNENGQSLASILVSLSDGADHVLAQVVTEDDGDYSFRELPWGLYWITGRRPSATVATAIFDHVNLDAEAPKGTINLVMLEPEIYQGKDKFHKPFLLKVTDNRGQPLAGVALDALWTSGDIADDIRAETGADGVAALALIPGRNYVTLKRRKCKNQDSRADVAEGDGIDGLSLQMDCAP